MKTNSTEDVLRRVDNYLSLLRYTYSSQEKLSRLNILKDYYSSKEILSSEEILKSQVICAEQLSKELKLPLKVRGIFLTEGKPKARYYRAEDLKKASENPMNASFPLMLDHKEQEVAKIVGKVDQIWYDEEIKGLRWKGHVNDETQALNIVDGMVSEVSATIYSTSDYDETLGVVWKDLAFSELSLVRAGSEPKNMIELDE